MFVLLLITYLLNFAHGSDYYRDEIQPIFDNRCVACHSCYNAPCQLNLQSYEGFDRGASKTLVYEGSRIDSIEPTRMWVDAPDTKTWRTKGFFSINTTKDPFKNIFHKMIAYKAKDSIELPAAAVEESNTCVADEEQLRIFTNNNPARGMPYGFPAITSQEESTISQWILKGTPGPASEVKIEAKTLKTKTDWEKFLNGASLKEKLVSRYLYEHLFLAHIYFENDSQYFRLVRSSKPCSEVMEIGKRRANDDPGVDQFWYCLRPFTDSIVSKTHLPYEFSEKKMKRIKDLFYKENWKISRLPGYETTVAENPFIVFEDIPAKSRYQFLLDDAVYHISTFIKGPVCNGSDAVNSIQEQFFVSFITPDSDLMSISPDFAKEAAPKLVLPGVFSSDVKLKKAATFLEFLIKEREQYRKLRVKELKKNLPNGYTFKDIWDGEGYNKNALLTVFRHEHNSFVKTGAAGDMPKTVFFLDYALMERLVYNLVVNFDVFGNVGHQLLTRVYMDLIRMEAEEMFLSFLPFEQRTLLRKSWYVGFFTELKMEYVFPEVDSINNTGIKYINPNRAKEEFVDTLLFQHFKPAVRGVEDGINWKFLLSNQPKLNKVEEALRKMASIQAKNNPFINFFPEISIALIGDEVYSILRNREHENISWIMGENHRYAPEEDTLTIRKGVWGSYPNFFFNIVPEEIDQFVTEAMAVKREQEFVLLAQKYGVPSMSPKFWPTYDAINKYYHKTEPREFGILDLTRYDIKTSVRK